MTTAVDRVTAVIETLERMHDQQHPLRRIPIDLVAAAVCAEAESVDLGDVAPRRIAEVLNVILARTGAAVLRLPDPADAEVVGITQGSSYLPHEGAARLRDGG